MSGDRRIEKLRRDHSFDDFDCGQADLNRWLSKYTLQSGSSGSAQTYAGRVGDRVVGYYSLSVGQVEHAAAPERVQKGLAKHPVPVMLLARLAVDRQWQAKGVGRSLIKNAVLRTAQASEIAGIRALMVHAKDQAARSFHEQFDFVPSPTDPLHLFVLLKDILKIIEA